MIEGLIAGIEKCRRIQIQCAEIGKSGVYLSHMLEQSISKAVKAISKAVKAMADDDVVAMVRAAKDIEGYQE